MKDKYYQEDVDQWIIDNSFEAYELLEESLPGYSKKLDRLDNRIAKLLKEIQEVFPDASFYTAGGDGFTLVLGETHEGSLGDPQYQRVAWNGRKAKICGGDW